MFVLPASFKGKMRPFFALPLAILVAFAAACGSSDNHAAVGGGGDASSPGTDTGGGGASAQPDGAIAGGDDAGVHGGGDDAWVPVTDAGAGASGDGALHDAGSCGSCPQGFGCNASGTYCVNGRGVPAFDHVIIIVMENESQTDIQGSSQAPYVQQLLAKYSYTNQYSTTYHPSLPNYLDLTSGSAQGITCDCQPVGTACDSTCSFFTGNCGCPKSATNIGDQLEGASVSWRNYAESMGAPCNGTLAAPYAPKHVPFLYYSNVYTNTSRCQQHVRDYGDFAADLAVGTVRYSLIAPNLCSDMHGDPSCPSSVPNITQGDSWLGQEVPKILKAPGFAPGGKDVLFIVWDEQTGSTGGASTPMLLIAVSPLAKTGPTAIAYNHESLLATVEDSFGLSRLGGAASATPITDIWK